MFSKFSGLTILKITIGITISEISYLKEVTINHEFGQGRILVKVVHDGKESFKSTTQLLIQCKLYGAKITSSSNY